MTTEEITQHNRKLINDLFIFIFNFPNDFIEQAWADRPALATHFREKFKGKCLKEGYGSPNAMASFFCELSDENRAAFADFVVKHARENY